MQSNSYPNPVSFSPWITPFVQAAILISDLIQNLTIENRFKLACDCIEKASDISFKAQIFQWLKRQDREKPDKDGFSEDLIQKIGEYLGNNIAEYLKLEIDITQDSPRDTPAILSLTKKYLGQTYLNRYFDTIFNKDPNLIIRLLDTYTSNRWSLGSGSSELPSKSDFERKEYDAIIEVLSADKVIEAIKRFNNGQLPKISDEFPSRYKDQDLTVLTEQFIWIHNYVLNELQEE